MKLVTEINFKVVYEKLFKCLTAQKIKKHSKFQKEQKNVDLLKIFIPA